jgi:hypothetical protein
VSFQPGEGRLLVVESKSDLMTALFGAFTTFSVVGFVLAGYLYKTSDWLRSQVRRGPGDGKLGRRENLLMFATAEVFMLLLTLNNLGLVTSVLWLRVSASGSRPGGWSWGYTFTVDLFGAEVALFGGASLAALIFAMVFVVFSPPADGESGGA